MMPVKQTLNGFTQVREQVPAICNLDRIGCALRCAFSISPGAVTADDLDTRMRLEPRGDGGGRAVREEFHRAAPLQVDEDGPVTMALLPGPVVNAQQAWRCCTASLSSPDKS